MKKKRHEKWIRFGGPLLNTNKFQAIIPKKKCLVGVTDTGRKITICKYKDKRDLKFALDLLGKKIESE